MARTSSGEQRRAHGSASARVTGARDLPGDDSGDVGPLAPRPTSPQHSPVPIRCTTLLAVADLHLGARRLPDAAPRLARLLTAAPDQADALLINGDLFDFHYAWPDAIPAESVPTLEALGALATRMPVVLVGGNHDRWGAAGWAERYGLHWARWSVELQVGDATVHCRHGDDLAYRGLRHRAVHAAIRSPLTQGLFGVLPRRGAFRAVRRFGPTMDTATDDPARLAREAALQTHAAEAWLVRHPAVRWLVLGHTHVAGSGAVASGTGWVNSGPFGWDGSYALLRADAVTLHRQA